MENNISELQQRQLDFLEDTIKYYSEDPSGRRSVENQYQNRKEALLELIREHNENCMRYLDYSSVKHMNVQILENLYNHDETMMDLYSQELLLLEAKWQLK